MCGIAGIIKFDGQPPSREGLDTALVRMAARGPDNAAVWGEEEIVLGHRRLSVVDVTAAGHQHMLSHDGRYVIVFNGEEYNAAEIRQRIDLVNAIAWRGLCDTEVMLEAYALWGAECLRHVRGMFAFVIWDRQDKRLFCARDRMGVKPFYYHASESRFVFASRPRPLFDLAPDISKDIDQQALRLYLEIGYIPAPHAFYQNIKKLPPAHYLIADVVGVWFFVFWSFRGIEPNSDWTHRPESELHDELDDIITCRVKMRLISDVPLGAFLSGVSDSSLVTAIMAKQSPGRVKTFSIGFDEPRYDESAHARAVATHLGTDHYEERLKVNYLVEFLPEFMTNYEEPNKDSSAFPTMAVSRAARKHVTAALSDDGRDELFGGYGYYRIAAGLEPLYRFAPPIRLALGQALGCIPKHRMKLLGAAMQQTDINAAFAFARSIAKDFKGVISDELRSNTRSISDYFSELGNELAARLPASERGMRLDASYTLPDDYLQKVDVASMAYSLECREPLLDHELVEWAMRLPTSWKLRGGENKYLLRKLAYRYVPRAILDRPKQGFGVPIDEWLRGPLKKWALDRLSRKELFEVLHVDQQASMNLMEQHLSGARNAHPLLWAILMLLSFKEAEGACKNEYYRWARTETELMRAEFCQFLACPVCGVELKISHAASMDGDEVTEGELQCTSSHLFPITKGIPRFVSKENYASNFGFQWNMFRRTQLDSYSGQAISGNRFWAQSGWKREELAGKRVLDVGCGAGRFVEIALEAGAQVVALDYSVAVEACRENHREKFPHSLNVVQGDIYHLPFRPGQFDFVYCFGVLQHTPDVRAAFLALPRQLAAGGRLAVDVYRKHWSNWIHPKYWFRPITTRLPQDELFQLVKTWAPRLLKVSMAVQHVPLLGRIVARVIPVANYSQLFPLTG